MEITRKLIYLTVIMLALSFVGCSETSTDVETNQDESNNGVYKEGTETEEKKNENDDVDIIVTQDSEDDSFKENVNEENNTETYSSILHQIYDALETDANSVEPNNEYFSTGIFEVVTSLDTAEERRKAISYCISDINKDGTEELLIVDMGYTDQDTMRILDMYTLVEGAPVKVISGWARNRLYLLDDGTIYNEGSGGAAYSSMQLFVLETGKTELTSQIMYFTYPKNDDMSEIGYYYSEDSVYDVSKAIEITSEEWRLARDSWQDRIINLTVQTFEEMTVN